MPPPTNPASVLKVMPRGVMSGYSRLTTTTPLASGATPMMHSKQPHEVMGAVIIEYRLTCSTVLLEVAYTNALMFSKMPSASSMAAPFSMGWLGPLGLIS